MAKNSAATTKPAEKPAPIVPPEATLLRATPSTHASDDAQNITVLGTDFVEGMTVHLINPSGEVLVLPAKQVQTVSATEVRCTTVLAHPGAWLMQAFKPKDLAGSNACAFSVAAAPVQEEDEDDEDEE